MQAARGITSVSCPPPHRATVCLGAVLHAELDTNANGCWENSLVAYHDSRTDDVYHLEEVSGKAGVYKHPRNEFEFYTGKSAHH